MVQAVPQAHPAAQVMPYSPEQIAQMRASGQTLSRLKQFDAMIDAAQEKSPESFEQYFPNSQGDLFD